MRKADMWSWFGGAAAQKRKDAPKNAILTLREQLDMLQKRERHLESQISDQDAVARKNINSDKNAAKNALRRKKVHEKNLEQTTAQIMQLEQQIYSIEAANINHETLAAMKQAGAAMKQIHGGMTLEDVDKTMYVIRLGCFVLLRLYSLLISRREQLQDQHALSAEIGSAITSVPIGEQPDEEELDAELEGLEQEAMDAKMVNTGFVPVGTQLDRLPAAGNTDRALTMPYTLMSDLANRSQSSNPPRQKTTKKPNWRNYGQKWPCDSLATRSILTPFSHYMHDPAVFQAFLRSHFLPFLTSGIPRLIFSLLFLPTSQYV
ncbi:unnamed protein product [Penicillium salamii]|nr:unnamed protein product [Penicillium salamii]CAG8383700.1 unnamed protein product [Penicillium salamii]